ncbi:MAG: M20/M25/M40 family metallo-hydrolase [Deltaproteobacteria bacterium]|nr:M20/M25/M40 family metallo-hydrolase [Deltaproteobacteria bacterium]
MDLIALAQQMIATNSVTTQGTRTLAEFLARAVLPELDVMVSWQEGETAADANLIARKAGSADLPALLLTSHLDTVPPGDPTLWTKTHGDPFAPVIEGDRLYGLGSADAKLDWLAKAAAIARFRGRPFIRPLLFTGTYGEERGLVGARRLLADPPCPIGYAFVGEPSELKLVHAHKGIIVCALRLTGCALAPRPGKTRTLLVTGRSAHSSTPARGENAILKALVELQCAPHLVPLSLDGGDAVNKVPARCEVTVLDPEPAGSELYAPLDPALVTALTAFTTGLAATVTEFSEADPEFSPPTLTVNVGEIHAEHDTASLLFDLRPLPGQDVDRLLARLHDLAVQLGAAAPIATTLEVRRRNPAFFTPYDAAILTTGLTVLARVGLPLETAAKAGCTEAGLYGERRIPALVCGAGMAGGNIHAPNEWTALSQLEHSVDLYAGVIEAFCLTGPVPPS